MILGVFNLTTVILTPCACGREVRKAADEPNPMVWRARRACSILRILGVFYVAYAFPANFDLLKITVMGKLNVSYSGDETDASEQRGELPRFSSF